MADAYWSKICVSIVSYLPCLQSALLDSVSTVTGGNDTVITLHDVDVEQASESVHHLRAYGGGQAFLGTVIEIPLCRAVRNHFAAEVLEPLLNEWGDATLLTADSRMMRKLHDKSPACR
jgi:hypothetical protein